MFFKEIFKRKSRKVFVFYFAIFFIVIFWSIERAEKIAPYGAVFYKMGLQCGDDCDQKKKLRYFQKAVYYDNTLIDAHYQLGVEYEKLGNNSKALESFSKAASLSHKHSLAYYKAGRQHFSNGDLTYALRYFLRSYRQGGYPKDINHYIARIYDQRGEYELAAAHYGNFVETNSEFSSKIYPRLAEIYYLHLDESAIITKLHGMRAVQKYTLANQLEKHYKVIRDL